MKLSKAAFPVAECLSGATWRWEKTGVQRDGLEVVPAPCALAASRRPSRLMEYSPAVNDTPAGPMFTTSLHLANEAPHIGSS
ncbi:hypothetical protein EYF80_045709 [Liparis tanakae]|uniref:Uncharacterized protein n=1 Tax=Liparis tanakae TaxID=230148 RepID=A0A4Z2FTJ5_9TELE|nr:hypothetical protein EYF80_045709 [Liparis tanakae]